MELPKTINVLIPDGERVLAKFVVNCLSSCKNIKIHVLSMDRSASIKYSRYIDSYTDIDKKEFDSEWISIIKEHIQIRSIQVLMPVEIENIQVISKSKEFINSKVRLLVPPNDSFNTTLDKWEFYKFLKKHNISTPISFDSAKSVQSFESEPNYPLLMKPRTGMGGFGITKEINFDAVKKAFKENKDYMAQELVQGYDIDMSVLCENGKVLAYTIQKGYVFSNAAYSAALGVRFVYEKAIYMRVSHMMQELQWSGFAHVDLRYDENDDLFKILEVNPRAWGSIEASKSVGINFPYLYILTALGISYEMPDYSFETSCANVGIIKILKSILKNKKSRLPFPDHGHQIGYFLDPLPLVKNYYNSKRKR